MKRSRPPATHPRPLPPRPLELPPARGPRAHAEIPSGSPASPRPSAASVAAVLTGHGKTQFPSTHPPETTADIPLFPWSTPERHPNSALKEVVPWDVELLTRSRARVVEPPPLPRFNRIAGDINHQIESVSVYAAVTTPVIEGYYSVEIKVDTNDGVVLSNVYSVPLFPIVYKENPVTGLGSFQLNLNIQGIPVSINPQCGRFSVNFGTFYNNQNVSAGIDLGGC